MCVLYKFSVCVLLYCMWFRYQINDALLKASPHMVYRIDISNNVYDIKCQTGDFSEINIMCRPGYKST